MAVRQRTIDQIIPIKYYHEAGLSVRAIAPATGLSPTTVLKILHLLYELPDEHGMIRAEKTRGLDGKERLNRLIDTTDRDACIRELRANGKTVRAIAAEIGCSVGTVQRVVRG